MNKRIAAALMAGVMTLSMASCSSEEPAAGSDQASQVTAGSDGTGSAPATRSVSPMQMSVNKETGDMTITRPQLEGTSMGETGTWSIFVYLCGSDLESQNGAGMNDITEMCWNFQDFPVPGGCIYADNEF